MGKDSTHPYSTIVCATCRHVQTEVQNRTLENMADRIKAVHANVMKQLEESNVKYKEDADKHKWLKVFQERYMVMVHLQEERFLAGTYNKLNNKSLALIKYSRRLMAMLCC